MSGEEVLSTHLTVLGKGCKPLELRGENRANREELAHGREEVRWGSPGKET